MSNGTAMAALQADIPAITKDGENPHFKSAYATYPHILAAIRDTLKAHKAAVIHAMRDGELVTQVIVGDELYESRFPLPASETKIQQYASYTSYAKRYNLTFLLNLQIQDEVDDDGNSVNDVTVGKQEERGPDYEQSIEWMKAMAKNPTKDRVKKAWDFIKRNKDKMSEEQYMRAADYLTAAEQNLEGAA